MLMPFARGATSNAMGAEHLKLANDGLDSTVYSIVRHSRPDSSDSRVNRRGPVSPKRMERPSRLAFSKHRAINGWPAAKKHDGVVDPVRIFSCNKLVEQGDVCGEADHVGVDPPSALFQ